jgi:hypothetical protein
MLRSAIPGKVLAFDPVKQTCTVQVMIQEIVFTSPPAQPGSPLTGTQNIPTPVSIKPLLNVPICMMRVPGWSITLPIVEETECLLIFIDTAKDGWWTTGNLQPPAARRRHSLSDAFALFGPWSQPNVLPNYSTSSMQIRSDDQSVMIDLAPGVATITAPTVAVNAADVNITASADVNITAAGVVNVTGSDVTIIPLDGGTF